MLDFCWENFKDEDKQTKLEAIVKSYKIVGHGWERPLGIMCRDCSKSLRSINSKQIALIHSSWAFFRFHFSANFFNNGRKINFCKEINKVKKGNNLLCTLYRVNNLMISIS